MGSPGSLAGKESPGQQDGQYRYLSRPCVVFSRCLCLAGQERGPSYCFDPLGQLLVYVGMVGMTLHTIHVKNLSINHKQHERSFKALVGRDLVPTPATFVLDMKIDCVPLAYLHSTYPVSCPNSRTCSLAECC